MSTSGKVRIVAGCAGGLWIQVPKNFESRPSQGRVKQAVFSSLGQRIVGARVLDLFAGSGSLGIEALSRGAAHCDFVEKNVHYAKTIRSNLQYANLHAQAEVFAQKAGTFLKRFEPEGAPYDLIFLDPPYSTEPTVLSDTELAQLLGEKLKPGAFIVWEHSVRDRWDNQDQLEVVKQTRYGDTSILCLSWI